MKFKQGRYSGIITPLSYFIDIVIINVTLCQFIVLCLQKEFRFSHFFTLSILWVLISVFNRFYFIYRYTSVVKVFNLLFKQLVLYALSLFSFSGMFSKLNIEPLIIFKILIFSLIIVSLIKILVYYSIKKFRSLLGGNYRKTIIIGECVDSQNLENYFITNKEAGYQHNRTFSSVHDKTSYNECVEFIIENKIEEIYCSLDQVDENELKKLVRFCENNLRIIKFIPSSSKIISKKLLYENYDSIPVLSLRKVPLQDSVNLFFKRTFDLTISILVIVFILSWLIPIIGILIKRESKGPVFFRQIRNGINYKEFYCYKFRSMIVNKNAHTKQAVKEDPRVTSFGKFLRKSSIDEMPQFINVLLGDMSVVGPRPHMTKENDKYYKSVEKYMLRHSIKPGITGLAQVSGFRGEVEKESDIVNRIRLDIFYLENWSLLLDIKIMIRTITNSLLGEEKAY